MNESQTSSPNNASHISSNARPHATLATSLGDDDDEPPIGGYTRSRGFDDQPSESAGVNGTKTCTDPTSSPAASGTSSEPTATSVPHGLATRPDAEKREPYAADVCVPPAVGLPKITFCGRVKSWFTFAFKPAGPTPTYKQSFIAAVRYTPLNICLLFIPVSWALHFTHQSPTLIFVFSALGIIPLAALLGLGTEQIALRTSSSIGGLLNATLGNIVELIIAGIALQQCELDLVQSSLLGGLLSNLLLVLGMAFLVGGFRFHQQEFQPIVAQLNSSLMTVAVIALIVPAAFHEYLGDRLAQGTELSVLLELSRGSSIILILIYIAYMCFQFGSHKSLFIDTSQISLPSSRSSSSSKSRLSRLSELSTSHCRDEEAQTSTGAPVPLTISETIATSTITDVESISSVSTASTIEHAKLNIPFALFLLVASTALAYETAENLVTSLEGLIESHPEVSKEWLTLIIIPIISNAAEHTTAVVVASKGKFDLAMSVAVGSCIQIALFVIPMLVLVAWGMDKPLMLFFDELETLVLFFSVLLVKFSVEDGKAHWMSGVVLIAVYALIALSFWNFPVTERLIQGQVLTCT